MPAASWRLVVADDLLTSSRCHANVPTMMLVKFTEEVPSTATRQVLRRHAMSACGPAAPRRSPVSTKRLMPCASGRSILGHCLIISKPGPGAVCSLSRRAAQPSRSAAWAAVELGLLRLSTNYSDRYAIQNKNHRFFQVKSYGDQADFCYRPDRKRHHDQLERWGHGPPQLGYAQSDDLDRVRRNNGRPSGRR